MSLFSVNYHAGTITATHITSLKAVWTQFLTLSSSRSNQFCMDIRHWCLLGEDEEARCSQGCEGGDEVAAACTSVFDKQHAACQHSYGGSTREGCRYLQPGQQSWAELSYSWQMAHAVQPRAKHVAHQLPIDTVFCLLNSHHGAQKSTEGGEKLGRKDVDLLQG